MAVVVNSRDSQILATNPRMLGVTLNQNVQVSQDNVTGLGLVIEGTKQIYLSSGTQVFQIAKDGGVTPSSVVVKANVKNLSATPTISVIAGSMSVTPVLSSGQFSYTPDQQLTDVVTFRLSLTQDGKTYTDDLTIVKVREGADAVTGLLTNESFTLPADYLGNVLSYSGCSGQFKVYKGTTDITTACTFSVISGGNPDGLTVAITGSGTTAGQYAVTAGYPTAKDVTTVTFRATYGSLTIDKVMSITKSKAGALGQRGSRTFYVATAGTSWSDATATTAASADAGPIVNDIVCMYNNAASFSVSKFWSGSAWVVINAVVDGNLLVNGTVGAQKINTTGLDIKDSNGNSILSASMVPGGDDAATLGFNPTFAMWTSSYPDGWVNWAGAAPTRVASSLPVTPFVVQYTTTASANLGMYHDYDFQAPLEAGTFLSGSAMMKVVTNTGGGASGYLVRLFTNAAKTTYVDTQVTIPDKSKSGWQKAVFTAGSGGSSIYAIRIYQMASWSGFPGGFASSGSVIQYGPFSFAINEPITASNVAVRVGTAAIGNAQIGRYIASSDWDGTVDSNGIVTVPGTRGWVLAKGNGAGTSKLEVDAATIRGQLTAAQIAPGSATSLNSGEHFGTGVKLAYGYTGGMDSPAILSFTPSGYPVLVHSSVSVKVGTGDAYADYLGSSVAAVDLHITLMAPGGIDLQHHRVVIPTVAAGGSFGSFAKRVVYSADLRKLQSMGTGSTYVYVSVYVSYLDSDGAPVQSAPMVEISTYTTAVENKL